MCGLSISAILVVATSVAWTNPVGGQTTFADIEAACQAALSEFRPIDQSDIDQAKQGLIDALDRLDERLVQAGPNGEDWREYLQWDKLTEALQAERPDRKTLARILTRYRPDHDGLELVWFLDVQRALHNYTALLGAVDNPAIRKDFESRLERLAKSLHAYGVKPTTEDALTISESIRWLQSAHQCPTLVAAIQTQLVQPNLFVHLSPELVGAGLAERVDDTMPVEDCILGTTIHGTAHTVGQSRSELVDDDEAGVINLLFRGMTHSENVGYHGRITICSTAAVNLSACKSLRMTADGLSALPTVSAANVATDIGDIQSPKGRRIVERMASKRADKMKPEAESIAARHAEQRLNDRIDARAVEPIEKANEKYVEKFQRPFTERKLFPETLRFSTTSGAFTVTAIQAGGGKVAAPSAPPSVAAQDAVMTLQLHESMINNLAFDALAGRTIYEGKVQAAAINLLGRLPDKMKGDDDGKPWAITFAPRQPISVSFVDDGFRVTIRGAKYFKGNEGYPAMDISAVYKIEKSAEGQFKIARQGGLDVFPPGFVPGGDKRLSGPQQVLRKLLEKRFSKVFEPEFLGAGFDLPGKWKSFGKLVPADVVCRDGWLVIAWKRQATPPNGLPAK
ncbi:MAG: hypothetical protein ABFC63_02630 [Thermoguttaceae bacterium]